MNDNSGRYRQTSGESTSLCWWMESAELWRASRCVQERESRGITRGWSSDHPIVGTKQLRTLLVGKQQTYFVNPTIGGARSGEDGGPTLSVLIV